MTTARVRIVGEREHSTQIYESVPFTGSVFEGVRTDHGVRHGDGVKISQNITDSAFTPIDGVEAIKPGQHVLFELHLQDTQGKPVVRIVEVDHSPDLKEIEVRV